MERTSCKLGGNEVVGPMATVWVVIMLPLATSISKIAALRTGGKANAPVVPPTTNFV
jgi:hypothetical protein